MAELLQGWKRTHYCAQAGEAQAGEELTLMGWAASTRNLGALIFVGLRDRTGVMQLVFDASDLSPDAFAAAESIRNEFVIAVRGRLARRAPDMVNPNMKTGAFEVRVTEFKILSRAKTPPIYIEDDLNAQEQLRLRYRYLDLRRPVMQKNLLLRHRVAQCARNYFDENGFLEIETPMLTKSTPEGARDYLVPSRLHPGRFYALPQSPQLFKQLLMLSGFDRYMQITRCFRDEDLRADRQPDFTQIDLEMSFVDEDDVMSMNEGFLQRVFRETLGIEISLPLPRLTYREAMERFGSDKPDTRFGLELINITDLVAQSEFQAFSAAVAAGGSVRAIRVSGGTTLLSRKDLDALGDFVKTYRAKGLAWMNFKPDGLVSPVAKFLTETELAAIRARANISEGDILLIVADANDETVFSALGALRLELASRLNLAQPGRFDLLWVTDFPLLEYSESESRFVAKHHPFTSPKDEDLPLLETAPARVRAKAYDIILNGNEIGGGSIRIHDSALQERMFQVLGFSKEEARERFGFLLEAFEYGPPPHGGLAYGLDRLAMLLCGGKSIRDVIAFPKVQNASCPLTGAPSAVDAEQLDELHIGIVDTLEQ